MHLRGLLPRAQRVATGLQDEIDRPGEAAVGLNCRSERGDDGRLASAAPAAAGEPYRQHSAMNPEGSLSWDDGVPFV
jgi:hypothetical protein